MTVKQLTWKYNWAEKGYILDLGKNKIVLGINRNEAFLRAVSSNGNITELETISYNRKTGAIKVDYEEHSVLDSKNKRIKYPEKIAANKLEILSAQGMRSKRYVGILKLLLQEV